MNKIWVAGNWKLNGSQAFLSDYAQAFKQALEQINETSDLASSPVEILLCPPSIYLASLIDAMKDAASPVHVGAQTSAEQQEGAYTGELAATMIADVGANFTLVGHSERRQFYSETDEVVAAKVLAAIEAGLRPVLCVGESLAEREAEQTLAVIDRQLQAVFSKLDSAVALDKLLIAYEPV